MATPATARLLGATTPGTAIPTGTAAGITVRRRSSCSRSIPVARVIVRRTTVGRTMVGRIMGTHDPIDQAGGTAVRTAPTAAVPAVRIGQAKVAAVPTVPIGATAVPVVLARAVVVPIVLTGAAGARVDVPAALMARIVRPIRGIPVVRDARAVGAVVRPARTATRGHGRVPVIARRRARSRWVRQCLSNGRRCSGPPRRHPSIVRSLPVRYRVRALAVKERPLSHTGKSSRFKACAHHRCGARCACVPSSVGFRRKGHTSCRHPAGNTGSPLFRSRRASALDLALQPIREQKKGPDVPRHPAPCFPAAYLASPVPIPAASPLIDASRCGCPDIHAESMPTLAADAGLY